MKLKRSANISNVCSSIESVFPEWDFVKGDKCLQVSVRASAFSFQRKDLPAGST